MLTRPRRVIAAVWLIALLVAGVAAWRILVAPPQGSATAAIGGPFTMVDHTGRTVTEAEFQGRLSLVFFGYTYCPDVCPMALSTMAEALDILGDDGAAVQPVFVTVDPDRDTPEQLKMYVGHFHPRLVGLTGTAEQAAAMAKAYRVYFAKVREPGADADDYEMEHTSTTYLMGPDGALRAHFGRATDAEAMARRLRELL